MKRSRVDLVVNQLTIWSDNCFFFSKLELWSRANSFQVKINFQRFITSWLLSVDDNDSWNELPSSPFITPPPHCLWWRTPDLKCNNSFLSLVFVCVCEHIKSNTKTALTKRHAKGQMSWEMYCRLPLESSLVFVCPPGCPRGDWLLWVLPAVPWVHWSHKHRELESESLDDASRDAKVCSRVSGSNKATHCSGRCWWYTSSAAVYLLMVVGFTPFMLFTHLKSFTSVSPCGETTLDFWQ